MLEVKNLSVAYCDKQVVNQISFSVQDGETVSIVGESGSGKSTILRAIQGLLGSEGRIMEGDILFDGMELQTLKADEMRKLRGSTIATVPQQAGLSMDPIMKIGKQFHEAILTKYNITRKESDERASACMRELSLKDPERLLNSYPVMLSGGTNQRVALAMAMVMEPKLILADEPTSALDVTVQVEVVEAMKDLKKNCDAAILMVTHNMGVVAQMSDHVGVMYNGDLVEWGTKEQIMVNPQHPYTRALMASVLRMDGKIPNVKTVLRDPAPQGCKFYARCPMACDRCKESKPVMTGTESGHRVMCFEVQQEGYHG